MAEEEEAGVNKEIINHDEIDIHTTRIINHINMDNHKRCSSNRRRQGEGEVHNTVGIKHSSDRDRMGRKQAEANKNTANHNIIIINNNWKGSGRVGCQQGRVFFFQRKERSI